VEGFEIGEDELVEAVTELLEADLLVNVDEPVGTGVVDRNSSWSYWGTEAKYFHFATKDAPYVVTATAETVDYFDEMVSAPQPPLIKRYPAALRLPLPRVRTEISDRFTDVILARRTVRDFKDQPITVEQLSQLCDLAFAPQQFVNAEPFGALPLRTYANAGARSELEVYVNAIDIRGVDPGLYHYNGIEHSLELLGGVLSREDMSYLSYDQAMCSAAPVGFFITARVDRVGHKYRNPRALRAIYADAGHLGQNFALVATACGLGAWQTLAFRDTEIERLLNIDGISETALYLLGAGVAATDKDHPAHTAVSLAEASRTNLYEDAPVDYGNLPDIRGVSA
jgi:SagB-type dehydrogenase family enzyme